MVTLLVSTRHRKRFAQFGFKPFGETEEHGRTLMMLNLDVNRTRPPAQQ